MRVFLKIVSVLVLSGIIFLNKSYAQTDTTSISVVTKGNSFEKVVSKVSYLDGFDDAGNTYVILADGRYDTDHYLAQINSSMNQTNYKKIEPESEGKKYIFEHIQLFNNDLYLFTSILDSKNKKKILFVQTIDKQTLLSNKDIRKVEEFDISKSIGIVTPTNKTLYFKATKDRSKLAVSFMVPFNENISVVVLDNKATVLWKRILTLKSASDVNYSIEFELNNAGDISYMLRSRDPNRILNSGQKSVYYVVGCFDKGATVKEFPLDIKDKAIKELSLYMDDSSLICAGYVCKLDPKNAFGSNKIWGSCFFKIDILSKKLAVTKYADFDPELFNMKNSDAVKPIEDDKNYLYLDYVTTSIVLNENGNVFLIGEFLKQSESTTLFGNILLIAFSGSGDIYWSKQIYKVQTQVASASSFKAVTLNDDLYLLFNDYVTNMNIKREELPETFKGDKPSVLAMVKIDAKGNATKRAMINYDAGGAFIIPDVAFQLYKKNDLMLIGISKSKYQLYKCALKK